MERQSFLNPESEEDKVSESYQEDWQVLEEDPTKTRREFIQELSLLGLGAVAAGYITHKVINRKSIDDSYGNPNKNQIAHDKASSVEGTPADLYDIEKVMYPATELGELGDNMTAYKDPEIIMPVFLPRLREHEDVFYQLAQETGVPPSIVALKACLESGGNAEMYDDGSETYGLFQVSEEELVAEGIPKEDWLNPVENGRVALKKLVESAAIIHELSHTGEGQSVGTIETEDSEIIYHPDVYVKAIGQTHSDGKEAHKDSIKQAAVKYLQVMEVAANWMSSQPEELIENDTLVAGLASAEVDARFSAIDGFFKGEAIIPPVVTKKGAQKYLSNETLPPPRNEDEEALRKLYEDYKDKEAELPLHPGMWHQAIVSPELVQNDEVNGARENYFV